MRIIRHLFNHDFNISAQNYAGWTALHKAVHTNRLDAVEVLLREGRIDYKLTTVKKVSYKYFWNYHNHFLLIKILDKISCKKLRKNLVNLDKQVFHRALTL